MIAVDAVVANSLNYLENGLADRRDTDRLNYTDQNLTDRRDYHRKVSM